MGTFISTMLPQICAPAIIIVIFALSLARLRQTYKQYKEIEQRRFLPVELNPSDIPPKLEEMMAQLRQRDFRYVGAYIDTYPTARSHFRTPTFVHVHNQLNILATFAMIPFRLGQAKMGTLVTQYPDSKVVQTIYSLPPLLVTFNLRQPTARIVRARNLEQALVRHQEETGKIGQQFGDAVIIRSIDDLMNEFHSVDKTTLRNNFRSTLSKAFLTFIIMSCVLTIMVVYPSIVYFSELGSLALVSRFVLLMTLISTLSFSVYHYLALRRSTL